LLAGRDVTASLIPAALELNQPLERFFAYHLPRSPQAAWPPFLSVEPATVVLGALKKAEQDDALIVRLVEMAGQPVTATVRLEGGALESIAFAPYEIKTFKVSRDGRWQPTNLLEEAVEA
jgi:alpha-mannosidase